MSKHYFMTDNGRWRLRKALKARSFISLLILIITLIILFVLALVEQVNFVQLVYLFLIGFILSSFTYFLSNRDVLVDIKSEEVLILNGIIEKKIFVEKQIPANGTIHSDFLGDVLPYYKSKDRVTVTHYALIVNKQSYRVSVDKFKRVKEGMRVHLVFSKRAKVFLDVLVECN